MTPFCFIDEVGLSAGDKNQPFLAIGLLQIENTGELQNELYKLHYSYSAHNLTKRKILINELSKNEKTLKFHELNQMFLLTRHHEFKYENLGFPNIEKYSQVLDILFKYKFKFDCIIVDKNTDDFNQNKHKDYWFGYTKYLNLLINNSIDSEGILILDFLHKPNESLNIVDEMLKNKIVLNAIQTDSQSHILLQVSDLLLGALIFNLKYQRGMFGQSNKVRARLEFQKILQNRFDLNADSFELNVIDLTK
jgi:Protein of unknown function (DUF3800)